MHAPIDGDWMTPDRTGRKDDDIVVEMKENDDWNPSKMTHQYDCGRIVRELYCKFIDN